MIRMGRHPDAKCVFTYVQSLCRQLHNLETKPSAVPTQESNQGHPCPPQAGTNLEEGDGGAGLEAGSGGDLRD
ncbi:hypothetical protein chiPu_0028090 [Chiloscyllium punctatum]|uniref:Uncharacterized protein n=1 Tax=Chiloscyllium punctatum TaxID=137246 RepID=A0A401TN49_CHIPU|nr:hypothetical protein [Chiloscyllium punctatum]